VSEAVSLCPDTGNRTSALVQAGIGPATAGSTVNDVHLKIHPTTEGDIVTLAVSGELDDASCPMLDGCLVDHCRPGARVVLDLRSLNFMDCAGIELLHRTYARAGLEGWTFAVMTPGERFVARRRAA